VARGGDSSNHRSDFSPYSTAVPKDASKRGAGGGKIPQVGFGRPRVWRVGGLKFYSTQAVSIKSFRGLRDHPVGTIPWGRPWLHHRRESRQKRILSPLPSHHGHADAGEQRRYPIHSADAGAWGFVDDADLHAGIVRQLKQIHTATQPGRLTREEKCTEETLDRWGETPID
jgi:hypothetical protein